MNTTPISTMASKMLPAIPASQLTYNAEKNVLLTMGYTSGAGNTYYKAIRMSDRLAVFYDLGQGYCRTFLNGITLFCWDGTKAKVIAKKSWGGYDYRFFNENFAREQSIIMLKNFLEGQMKALENSVSEQEMLDFSRQMINETQQKMLN